MTDPGLPPKHRTLNLLESLVKEEEAKAAERSRGSPNVSSDFNASASDRPEFYDADKQQISRENSLTASFTEFKMKETNSGSKVKRGDPHAGFKGKKLKKQQAKSAYADSSPSQKSRPYSADYKKYQRNESGRPSTAKARRANYRTSSPKGLRPRSTESYPSDSCSSDEEKENKKKNKTGSEDMLDKDRSDIYDFFDSDKSSDDGKKKKQRKGQKAKKISKRRDSSSESEDGKRRNRNDSSSDSEYRNRRQRHDSSSESDYKQRKHRRDSSSDSEYKRRKPRQRRRDGSSDQDQRRVSHKRRDSYESSSNHSDEDKNSKSLTNGHAFGEQNNASKEKTVNGGKSGHQRAKYDIADDSNERKIVVEDCSTWSFSSSDDEQEEKNVAAPSASKSPLANSKRLLSRKKRKNCRILQINPDKYLEGKLHQKYTELEELLTCSFVDQRSHVTRHHLYQMELLRDQYQAASHGHISSATIIPRSLPGDIRNRSVRPVSAGQRRPTSAKRSGHHRQANSDQESEDNAYRTLRSVMTAEHARKKNKIRTDINAEQSASVKHTTKKQKKTKTEDHRSESEEETSERPSFASSKGDSKGTSSLNTTPRSKVVAGIDHHVKFSENEKLKKWLKEKDKIYRKQRKEERKKKREEREKLILEANEKMAQRIDSQKKVKQWMKEKNKEYAEKCRFQRQKEKEEMDREKKKQSLPGDAMKIRPQSAPARRSDDVTVDEDKIKGGDTPEYVKDQIHLKREIEEENMQAKLAEKGTPHPPQTKFIYKRPVAGKIKLKMQVRGKSPVAQKNEPGKENGDKSEDEKEKSRKMRMSYDDWVKKKRVDDVEKKRNAERQRQLAKSDPELERIIPALGKKRIEDKLNSRKRIDTGIKKFDNKVNKSFGGGDFDGEGKELPERPRSAYRLESDRLDNGQPALTVTSKELQRPSTAPAARGRPAPSPKKSLSSPRKAVIPQKVDKIMDSDDTSNPYNVTDKDPYSLPFSPEKGIPVHVAERQRKLFADIVTRNLNEIEQRALLNAELIKEGVSDEDIEKCQKQMEADFARYREGKFLDEGVHGNGNNDVSDNVRDKNDHPNITEIMYSPRKREDSSDSSSDENTKDNNEIASTENENKKKNDNEVSVSEKKLEKDEGNDVSNIYTEAQSKNVIGTNYETNDNTKSETSSETVMNSQETDMKNQSHYGTFENLNELNIDVTRSKTDDSYDINLHREPDNHSDKTSNADRKAEGEIFMTEKASVAETSNIKIVAASDPNVVSILKESRSEGKYPEPESSEEPAMRENLKCDQESETAMSGSKEDLTVSRKRVSFNEKTEVFQSFDSSSTDTVTPGPDDFDAKSESLDAQEDIYDSFLEDSADNDRFNNEENEQGVESKTDYEDDFEDGDKTDTFITNPDEEPGLFNEDD